MAKKRLGRGLNALIPEMPETVDNGVKEIDISAITPNRNQPRQDFDQQKLEELAGSIAQHGIVQPILLRRLSRGYEIVAGERRWRAARLAGLKAVPAIVKELDDRQVMEMALIENLQREDLNPLEEAEAYKRLSEEFGLTQEDISNAVGKSRPAIANTLRLLGLQYAIGLDGCCQFLKGHIIELLSGLIWVWSYPFQIDIFNSCVQIPGIHLFPIPFALYYTALLLKHSLSDTYPLFISSYAAVFLLQI
jgi:ParB/RepB/Spo0J family partition protein